MENNPFIAAFAQPDVLDGFDHARDRIVVMLDGRIVGTVSPKRPGYHEMAYAYEYRGATRGADGVTPIGPAFDIEALRRRTVSVMFNGDAGAFSRARLCRVKR